MAINMFQSVVAVLFLSVVGVSSQNNFITNIISAGYTTVQRNHSDEINFHLYTKANKQNSDILKTADEENIRRSQFNKDHETKIYIHGWTGKISDPIMRDFVDVHLNGGKDNNVIIVEWKSAINLNFISSAIETERVGMELAAFLKSLTKIKNLNLKDVHLYGFSLGAHVAGVAGYKLNSDIGRITGLDPAGPRNFEFLNFFNDSQEKSIDSSDAKFVDIIHTNAIGLGMTRPVGHVDYYVDGGVTQNGCGVLNVGCSHGRVLEYMLKFLSNLKAFSKLRKCATGRDAIFRTCNPETANFYMGQVTHERGVFLVETF